MQFDQTGLAALLALGTALVAVPALAQTSQELEAANPNPNDWLSYHGTYKGYDYSGLDQINASNVKDLQVAWMHFPGKTTRGIKSMPLAKDGVLYYSGSYSRVFALDGATGKVLWTYFPNSTTSWSPGKLTRPIIAAWPWATASFTSAPSTGG